jgi:activator of HSP90 ATPase
MNKTVTIKQKEFIEASPEEVYEAYLDPKKHAAFTGAGATGVPKAGGDFTAWDGYISGKYLKLEKGKRIVQEWVTTEWPDGYGPSVVDLSFGKKGNGTEILMVHSKIPAEQADSYAQGWIDFYWKPMKKYFEKRK